MHEVSVVVELDICALHYYERRRMAARYASVLFEKVSLKNWGPFPLLL